MAIKSKGNKSINKSEKSESKSKKTQVKQMDKNTDLKLQAKQESKTVKIKETDKKSIKIGNNEKAKKSDEIAVKAVDTVVKKATKATKKLETERIEKVIKPETVKKTEKSVKSETIKETEKPVKSETVKKTEKSVKSEMVKKVEKPVKSEMVKKVEKPAKTKSIKKAEKIVKAAKTDKSKDEYKKRFDDRYDELKWLYIELYGDMAYLNNLTDNIYNIYNDRDESLKSLDRKREKTPDFYKSNKIVGMNIKVDLFCDNFENFTSKLKYIKELGVNFLHLMPVFNTPNGFEDNGFAVSDYRLINPRYGSNESFKKFVKECKKNGISISTDFTINHTSDRHPWAMEAKLGSPEYQNYYFLYDNFDVPAEFEKSLPQRFPNSAPGNFTYIDCINKHAMTSFNRYQWDLNYKNPVVFNEMVYNLLFVANLGVDVIKLDALEYIWKELYTNCRALSQSHNITRIIRLITEIVCPGVLLSTEIDDEGTDKNSYLGTAEHPECHILYNSDTMINIWNSLATRDVRMLNNQLSSLKASEGCYINFLRSFFDVNVTIPEDSIKKYGFDPYHHRKFLCDFLCGTFPDSFSRGESYSFNPYTGESCACGTTSSLCGLEKALFENDEKQAETAIKRISLVHAFISLLPGIPLINSGDEIGILNDYSYKDDNNKCVDERNLHRVKFDWDKAGLVYEKGSIENKIFASIKAIENIRAKFEVFSLQADFASQETENISVISIIRKLKKKTALCIFNFSEGEKKVSVNKEFIGECTNMKTGRKIKLKEEIEIQPYSFELFCKDI